MIVLQFYPNGEFSQGVDTSAKRRAPREKPKHKVYSEYDKECRDGYLRWSGTDSNADVRLCVPGQQFENQQGGVYTYLCEDTKGHHYAYEGEGYVLEDVLMNEPVGRMVARGELIPLVYQSVESSPVASNPSRKRLTDMTKNMARNIRNSVYLLEQDYGKDQLSFLTLTLPSLSTDELGTICERWQDMTDQILKWLRKRLQSKGIEFEYVYCTEIQSKRLHLRGEYAPHLHIVFRGRNGRKAPWAIAPKMVRKAWSSIIAGVIDHRNFRTDALENIQRIKFSAARYLSKYLSKGSCSTAQAQPGTPVQRLRTQWGGMARKLSRKLKSCTARITSTSSTEGMGAAILRNMDELVKAGIVKYWRQGYIPITVCPYTGVERVLKVGSGCLSTPTYESGLIRVMEHLLAIDAI
jgi:hypothetical protein